MKRSVRRVAKDASRSAGDPWAAWRSATPARVALGRVGSGMPTDEVLRFGWAHAMARDAIHVPLDVDALAAGLAGHGWELAFARSAAPDRMTYLRRPDLGRRLDPPCADELKAHIGPASFDLCFVVADGLSSLAVARHAVPLLEAVRPQLAGMRIAPVIIATQARVALSDEIGALCGARLVVMLVGERPGLSAPDSLGVYMTYAPRRGRSDAQRNCISNIRPEGLGYEAAAFKLGWLVREALRRGCTGVELKDESDIAWLADKESPPRSLGD